MHMQDMLLNLGFYFMLDTILSHSSIYQTSQLQKNLGIIVAGMLGLLLNEIWTCGGYYVFRISSNITTDKSNVLKSLNIDLYTWKK